LGGVRNNDEEVSWQLTSVSQYKQELPYMRAAIRGIKIEGEFLMMAKAAGGPSTIGEVGLQHLPTDQV